ncbi:hypothetical protein L596_014409 [Steinernema carpocapsae]|uniref:Hexosyltransferase n=1 Tax=Steinernema carpocapsae TaxID=34508 RepID=A0A4U5NCN8_STECR|nr:hypothetical protein L596_014409 [Steinernema carpocapsae]
MALSKLYTTAALVVLCVVALLLLNLYFLGKQKDYDIFFETHESMVRTERRALGEPKFVILVLSKRSNVERRNAIRETWAKEYAENFGWRTRFVIGEDENEGVVHDEEFRDVIKVNVTESYLSLIDKLSLGFKFVLKNEKFQTLVKVDDDVYLNLRPLLSQGSELPEGQILGHAIFGSMASTDPVDKYFSEPHAAQKVEFPSFASGTGYLMTRTTLKAIVEECSVPTTTTQYEDVYFTGYCRRQLGFQLVEDKAFGYQRRLVLPCNIRQFVIVHNMTAGNLRYVHEMLNMKISC